MPGESYKGTVSSWDADAGFGDIEVPALGLVWGHFSAIVAGADVFRELSVGEWVQVQVSPRPPGVASEAPGYRWVADRIEQIGSDST